MTSLTVVPCYDRSTPSRLGGPTITVLVYCPDSSIALQVTLDSLLDQTYHGMEVVLLHKPGFMASAATYEQLSELDPHGVVRMLPVGEQADIDEALLLGLSVATGELILPLISGDEIECTTLESCVRRFTDHSSVDIIYTTAQTRESDPPENQADGCPFDLRESPIEMPYPAMMRRTARAQMMGMR